MEKSVENVKVAQEKFGELIQSEFERIERMKADNEVTDFDKLEKIVIGVLPGDGIGPIIMKQALRVLNDLLAPEIASGRVEIREIEGMTIENRAAKLQSLPDDEFEEIKNSIDEFIEGNELNRFIVLPGIRGVGKTTLLYQAYYYLLNENFF